MKSEDLAGEIDCTEIKQLAKQPKKERNQKQNQKQKQVGNWDSPWALSTDIYIMALCPPFQTTVDWGLHVLPVVGGGNMWPA